MPRPISPVVPGLEPYEIEFGKGQPEFNVLPALRGRGPHYAVMARWQLTKEERELIAKGADVYVSQLTFGGLFQASNVVIANSDDLSALQDVVIEQFGYKDELAERISKVSR